MTPKERRAQMIKERAGKKKSALSNFLTKKRTPLKTGKRARDMANVEKELPRGKPAASQMEDYKPGATAGKATGKAAAKPSTAKRVMAGISEFGKAFAKARKAGKKDFTFRDKQYAAITKQEVQKAGASNLKEYLNKLKRKDTKIAKAPGQLKKGGILKRAMGGSVNEEGLQKVSDRAAMIEKTKSSLGLPTAGDEVRARREAKAKRETNLARRRLERIEKMRAAGQQDEIEFIKRMRGRQISDMEGERLREMMGPSGMKKGGSVMARGCKMGKKKPTKLY